MLRFFAFFSQIDPALDQLLADKDPGALLLLAYWYAKVIPFEGWFLGKRALIECRAICIYLERYHGDLPNLQDALAFPKAVCGMAPRLGQHVQLSQPRDERPLVLCN